MHRKLCSYRPVRQRILFKRLDNSLAADLKTILFDLPEIIHLPDARRKTVRRTCPKLDGFRTKTNQYPIAIALRRFRFEQPSRRLDVQAAALDAHHRAWQPIRLAHEIR